MTEPTDAFSYQEREAHLHEQERRRDHEARMDTHDAEPLPPIPRLTSEENLRERMIAELEGILGHEYQVVSNDNPRFKDTVVLAYLIESLLAQLKEGEI